MDIRTADRLISLRKKAGYSQEQLAEKLGVSRQAISKWERAESSPDTDNLIALAKLYNVSLDELLLDKEPNNKEEKEEQVKENGININKTGIHIVDGEDEVHIGGGNGINIKTGKEHINVNGFKVKDYIKHNKKSLAIYSSIISIIGILSIAGYLLLGFYVEGGWATGWLLFFVPLIVSSIYDSIRTRKPSRFAMPLLVTGIYVLIGMLCGIWHPTWILFLLIPIFYTVCAPIEKKYSELKPKDFIIENEEDK